MARKQHVRVTEAHLDAAFEALASGKTLTAFCKGDGLPERRSIVRAINQGGPEVQERFRVAREIGYDAIAEEVLELADAPLGTRDGKAAAAVIQQRKLQTEVRLRLLSKWCTARYGDKLQLGGDGGHPIVMSDREVMDEVMAILADARARQLRGEKPVSGNGRTNGPSD